jgi:hypothetical protein
MGSLAGMEVYARQSVCRLPQPKRVKYSAASHRTRRRGLQEDCSPERNRCASINCVNSVPTIPKRTLFADGVEKVGNGRAAQIPLLRA